MAIGRVLIVGAEGMLGNDMLRLLTSRYDAAGADIKEVDITNQASVDEFLPSQKPGVVVNCAGYTNVDGCETNPEIAFKVNADGPANLARGCRRLGVPLVQMSTDFVFDGEKKTPYTEEDVPNPISKYAESKLAGEVKISEVFDDYLIIRSTWLFGFSDKSFVRFILRKAAEGGPVPVYSAQRACPTYTLDAAEGIINLLERDARGIFHFVNSGHCNRLEFVNEIFDIRGYDKARIKLVDAKPASWTAKRPGTSILSTEKYKHLTGKTPRTWQEALRDCLEKDTR